MCHPQVIRSRKQVRHNGGDTLISQDHRAGLRALPLKVMECEKARLLARDWRCNGEELRRSSARYKLCNNEPMKSLKSFDVYGYVWRHLSGAGMMGHSTLACPVMGRRSGNR